MFNIGDRVEFIGEGPLKMLINGEEGVVANYRETTTNIRCGYDVKFGKDTIGWGIEEHDLRLVTNEPSKEEKIANKSFWDTVAE